MTGQELELARRDAKKKFYNDIRPEAVDDGKPLNDFDAGWKAAVTACEAESNLATDELAKEAPTPAHMEALYELYEQMYCAGPIDSFTVKEILARIQATDTRLPVDIEKIAKAVKKLREAK